MFVIYCDYDCMRLRSTHARVRVNLTQVITRYFKQQLPNFKYTTIQFNKNS